MRPDFGRGHRRAQDAHLAHSAAEHLAQPPPSRDQVCWPGQDRAHRRAEALHARPGVGCACILGATSAFRCPTHCSAADWKEFSCQTSVLLALCHSLSVQARSSTYSSGVLTNACECQMSTALRSLLHAAPTPEPSPQASSPATSRIARGQSTPAPHRPGWRERPPALPRC